MQDKYVFRVRLGRGDGTTEQAQKNAGNQGANKCKNSPDVETNGPIPFRLHLHFPHQPRAFDQVCAELPHACAERFLSRQRYPQAPVVTPEQIQRQGRMHDVWGARQSTSNRANIVARRATGSKQELCLLAYIQSHLSHMTVALVPRAKESLNSPTQR